MEKMILIGKRVEELRRRKNITLSELSKISGVQIATLSRIENDKMTGTLETHARIAKALDVDLCQLYKLINLENICLKSLSAEITKQENL